MTENLSIFLAITQEGRLDKTLTLAAQATASDEGLSRVRVQQLIKGGDVTLDGVAKTDPKAKVTIGDIYQVEVPPPAQATPEPQDIPLTILFEDDELLVINKPAGLVVHPAAGNWDGTLVNALLYHCRGSLSGIGGVARPGIVHRLDKDTSGLMVAAKNDFAHQALTAQFSDRSLSRVYKALVWGVPAPVAGMVEATIGRHPRSRQKMAVTRGGKDALTYYKVLDVLAGGLASMVECKLATGRTHQIRVHMAHVGNPVVGDPLYEGRHGRQKALKQLDFMKVLQNFPRQALHAGDIAFIHPRTKKKMSFSTPLPIDMEKLSKALKKKKTYSHSI